MSWLSWFVDMETVKDMMRGLPFKPLECRKPTDPYLGKKYELYISSAFNRTSYVIVIFYKHKEDDNKNKLHIQVYSPKLEIDKNFKVEKFQYGDHNRLKRLMEKVLLF